MAEMGQKKLNTLMDEPNAVNYPRLYLSGPDAMAVPLDAEAGDKRPMKALVHITSVSQAANGDRSVELEIISAEVAPKPEPSAASKLYPSMNED